jgi:hypothetical protein
MTAYILTGLRLKAPDDAKRVFQGESIAIRDLETLEELLERLVVVSSWAELLA